MTKKKFMPMQSNLEKHLTKVYLVTRVFSCFRLRTKDIMDSIIVLENSDLSRKSQRWIDVIISLQIGD